MASTLVNDLIESGVHFGHRASRWNPRMSSYIFGKRNSIHIIDIRETIKGLLKAKKFLSAVVAQGHSVLFVGTKRQARDIVEAHCKRIAMPYVNERWLGGTLTNFKTIRSRLARLEELETLESTGEINSYSKKMMSTLDRERRKITRNLDGIRTMSRLPGALVVLDIRREHIAIKEAQKMGIPTVCLVDTDSDPSDADIVVPGNDDAMRAIEIIVGHFAEAIEEGKRARPDPSEANGDKAGGPQKSRSRRLTTSEQAEHAAQLASGGSSDVPAEAMAVPSPRVDAAGA